MRLEKVGRDRFHFVEDEPPPQKPWYSDAMEEAHRRTLEEASMGEAAPRTEAELRADWREKHRKWQADHGEKSLSTDEIMERFAKSRALIGGPSHKRAVEYLLKRAQSGDLKGPGAQKRVDDILRLVVERDAGSEAARKYVESLLSEPNTALLAKGGRTMRRQKRKRSTRRRKTKGKRRRRTKRRSNKKKVG